MAVCKPDSNRVISILWLMRADVRNLSGIPLKVACVAVVTH